MTSNLQSPKKKSKLTLKGVYLTVNDSQRLEEIRRALMHEEIVAPYSHIVSAGILLLHTMKKEVTVKLLKMLWEERGPSELKPTVSTQISREAQKIMKETESQKGK